MLILLIPSIINFSFFQNTFYFNTPLGRCYPIIPNLLIFKKLQWFEKLEQ